MKLRFDYSKKYITNIVKSIKLKLYFRRFFFLSQDNDYVVHKCMHIYIYNVGKRQNQFFE